MQWPLAARGRGDTLALAALTLVWIGVIASVGIAGDFPLNDDWAYAWSARNYVATGNIRILDWVAPMLVSHVVWGGLLLRLFGDSAVVLRAGSLFWGWVGMLALYALGRRTDFEPRRAAILAAAVGLSPWYVNLAFTFMTDVPWCGAYFVALALLIWGKPGQVAPLLGAGTLLALATLSRQYALVTLPAVAIWAAIDARLHAAMTWKASTWRALCVSLPGLIAYVPCQLWYTTVHGPTLANRGTWARMAVPGGLIIKHVCIFWHYFSWWALPWVVAVIVARQLRQHTSVRQIVLTVACLGGFALYTVHHFDAPRLGFDSEQPWMPYLSNMVYNFGIGPLTFFDAYMGITPRLHAAAWLNVALTGCTVGAGCFVGGWVMRAVRLERVTLAAIVGRSRPAVVKSKKVKRGPVSAPDSVARRRGRLLWLGVTTAYLALHLLTGQLIFDRYLIPAIPAVIWFVLDAVPKDLGRSPAVLTLITLMALFSVGGTREYLAWNRARAQAVTDMLARGIATDAIDAGFEYNGPWRFQRFFARTGSLFDSPPYTFWSRGTRYKLSFWPAPAAPALSAGPCRTAARYPFWSWPGLPERAVHVLDCE